MERTIEVRHVSLEINADFESFTHSLEQSLGRFEYSLYEDIDTDPQFVEKRLEQSAGEEGLMLFNIQDHGKLLKLFGTARKAKQYVLGNPLVAITMTRHDLRAGLYAPLRIFVYEADDQSARVEFDQPSSLFGQFNNPEITTVARSLDMKVANLIKKSELAAEEARAR
jgi:uncharacterized protein (DUF302 family)